MMRVAELTGAHLDYWVARAEGIPAEQLTIRKVPRTDWLHLVRFNPARPSAAAHEVLNYSTDWGQGGPLIEKHKIEISRPTDFTCCVENNWGAGIGEELDDCGDRDSDWLYYGNGDTPLQAICRAVVRAAFGDEVPDIDINE